MIDQPLPKRARGRPRSAFTDTSTQTVQALDKGVNVLGTLARLEQATLSDLALAVGLPRALVEQLVDFRGRQEVGLQPDAGRGAQHVGIGGRRPQMDVRRPEERAAEHAAAADEAD